MALAVGQTMLNKDGLDHARLRNQVSYAFNAVPPRATRRASRRSRTSCWMIWPRSAVTPSSTSSPATPFRFRWPSSANCSGSTTTRRAVSSAASRAHCAQPARGGWGGTREVIGLLDDLVAIKERDPADDLTTRLLQAHHEEKLSRLELLDSLMLLVIAGHDTT